MSSALSSPSPPPPLRPWSRIWRYGVALLVGLIVWLGVAAEALPVDPDAAVPDAVGVFLLLDVLAGLAAVALLPLRRRWPVVTVTLTGLLTSISGFAVGAAALAAVSMSTRRRWRGVVVGALVWALAAWVYEGMYRRSIPGADDSMVLAVASGALAVVGYAMCVATGFYIGARRDLLVQLRERADTAEREQALKADAAREAERTRIAREMHDVLAHRISLVAMHAGAMAYRTDLTREQTAEAAGIIQANAHLALTELRGVLGVLRNGADGGAEPPQPTLAELPALVADVREAGTDVHVDLTGLPGGDASTLDRLSETTSRTAFRILQEALTNACKHAPGESVDLALAGAPGDRLTFRVRNRLPVGAPAGAWAGSAAPLPAFGSAPTSALGPGSGRPSGGTSGQAIDGGAVRTAAPGAAPGVAPGVASGVAPGAVPGAGMGLLGLVERAELAGGSLRSGPEDGVFVVAGWLPWS
ncbi:histidine kinase [Cellulomonas sp. ATA003]|uniref:sensor histidine kinase n=1 Tax=Cellulomonas sp. ATA003 TaxID=3073064 RepID=UPI002873CCAF|nr:histidine kinase [Cellulomonas sp. ATA003]WNB85666.1 histidine kinase [Cellulomonas sp. ATA003]